MKPKQTGDRPQETLPRDRGWKTTAAVALVALVPRLWHLAEYARTPWFRVLQMDAKYHAEWAGRLVTGNWSDPQVFYRAPVYPYFLACLQMLTGGLLWPARVAQILMGVATVILTHRLARRILPGRWSTAAGILAALAWVPIHYETELLLEPLVTLLTTLSLFLAVRSDRRPGAIELLGWGALAGLAAATRPNALVLLPLLPIYAAAGTSKPGARTAGSRSRGGNRWPAWLPELPRPALLILAGFLIPVLPVWGHNARHGDPATVLAWQGGINLYLGNNPAANGWSATSPELRPDWRGGYEDAIQIAVERGGGRPLRPSQVSTFWTGEARRFWANDPGRALRLTGTKVLLFWGNTEIKNNEDPEFMHRTMASLRWLPVSFGLLAPLALIGLWLAWRRGPQFRLVAAFSIAWFASILPFFVCARYRLPVTPLMPLLALLTVREGIAWWRGRRWKTLLPVTAVVLALYPVLFVPRADVRAGGFFQAWCNLGDAYGELGEWKDAAEAYRRSLDLNPRYVATWNNLGRAEEMMGNLAGAERAHRKGLEIEPSHPTLRRNLGIILDREGKHEEAVSVFRSILKDYPQGWDTSLLLSRSLEAQGKKEEAVAVCQEALARDPRIVALRVRMVPLLRELGRGAEAERILDEGLRFAPGNRELQGLRAPR